MMKLTEIFGLEDFGLRSREELAALRTRKVAVDIHWTTPALGTLLHLSPRERKRLVSEAYWQGINKLQSLSPEARRSRGKWTLKAESLAKLPKIKNIGPMSLVSVQGIRKRLKRGAEASQHFAVLVRLVEQVAGKRRGLESTDDRTVIVRAKNAREAKLRADRHFRRTDYTAPYVLPSGDPVRWRPEKVLGVRRVVLDPLRDGITTVWSQGGKRRMRPSSGWRP
jgi:hypothetical protein